MTGYRSYSHSVQFFRPVKTIVRTDEANSMAFLQREFLPSNDTYKTKTSAGNTLNFIRGNENFTHSVQGETVFLGENFLFRISDYAQRERKCSFRKLQIFISQTTDFHFTNYRFSFRKLQISISQTTDFHFVSSHFVSFHFVSSHFVSQTTVSRTIDLFGRLNVVPNSDLSGLKFFVCFICMIINLSHVINMEILGIVLFPKDLNWVQELAE